MDSKLCGISINNVMGKDALHLSRAWENSRKLCKTQSRVCKNFDNSPNLTSVEKRLRKHRKSLLLLLENISEIQFVK